MIAGLFEVVAKPMEWMYSITDSYIAAISFMALIVMVITAPLVLKSTKGMLEMQRLAPEMRRLQNEHRGDRQKLNEEMMKLYSEHKVNPMASCFPLLLQMPVFFIMFKILHGLTDRVTCKLPESGEASARLTELCGGTFDGRQFFEPNYISSASDMFRSLFGKNEMISLGLDLSRSPVYMMQQSFGKGMIYALIVVALGALYFAQQKMVAARATLAPNMSAGQAKLMQYLPVVFAVFLVFYLTGLVIYYMAQAVFRIGLQYYITRKFYHGDDSLGRQAQRAGEKARELAQKDGGGGGMFAQAKRDMAAAKEQKNAPARPAATSKRVTPPKGKPTPSSARTGRPSPTGKASRPAAPNRPPSRSTQMPDASKKKK